MSASPKLRHTAPLLCILVGLCSGQGMAAGEVTELITRSQIATPASIAAGSVTINWGQGSNQHLEGFIANNRTFTSIRSADRVSVVRRDLSGVATGELCGVFAERTGGSTRQLNPDLPVRSLTVDPTIDSDRRGCDMSALLMSTLINRGTLDTFTNVGNNPNNIERLDYLFDGGLVAPLNPQALALAGHAFGEKNGNNRLFIAAVLGLDETNQPNAFGPLVRIGRIGECDSSSICYGDTSLVHDYAFLKSRSTGADQTERPVGISTESVAFAYLSLATLGLSTGETYYGLSVFPSDTNPDSQDLLDVSTYPDDTEEPEISASDSADIYGGTTGYFEANLSGVEGRLVCSSVENDPSPLGGIAVNLHLDSNEDGVLDVNSDSLVASLEGTGADGKFSFSGLVEGTYFIVIPAEQPASATVRTFVVAQDRVELADIVLSVPCATIPGPIANNDQVNVISTTTTDIAVLENDVAADGTANAGTLEIISFSGSGNAELILVDRTIQYTANADFADTATEDSPALDSFTYEIRDENGLTSEATVSVTVQLVGDPTTPTNPTTPGCPAQAGTDCLFVETEVDGIGSLSPLKASILFLLIVMRTGRQRLPDALQAGRRNALGWRLP